MVKLIPIAIQKDINSFSKYIDSGSKFSGMDENRLFSHPVNVQFIKKSVMQLLKSEKFVETINKNNFNFVEKVKSAKDLIKDQNLYDDILDSLREYKHIQWEVFNPVERLAIMNKKFITSYAQNLVLSPDMLFPNYYQDNSEFTDYEYNTESWSDGTWHPEHLFTNTRANKRAGYWHDLEVSVNANSDKHELGHKYNSEVYNSTRSNKFPAWQYTPNYRYHDRDNSETLQEGGRSDRRTNFISGYNMHDLRTYKHNK